MLNRNQIHDFWFLLFVGLAFEKSKELEKRGSLFPFHKAGLARIYIPPLIQLVWSPGSEDLFCNKLSPEGFIMLRKKRKTPANDGT